ncbi:hypothetical protein GCM10020255_079050 [Rhodococcus baikonurensis]
MRHLRIGSEWRPSSGNFEDLSFAILHPKKYDEIVRLVADRAPSRDTYLAKVRAEINSTLSASRINAIVEGGPSITGRSIRR